MLKINLVKTLKPFNLKMERDLILMLFMTNLVSYTKRHVLKLLNKTLLLRKNC